MINGYFIKIGILAHNDRYDHRNITNIFFSLKIINK